MIWFVSKDEKVSQVAFHLIKSMLEELFQWQSKSIRRMNIQLNNSNWNYENASSALWVHVTNIKEEKFSNDLSHDENIENLWLLLRVQVPAHLNNSLL